MLILSINQTRDTHTSAFIIIIIIIAISDANILQAITIYTRQSSGITSQSHDSHVTSNDTLEDTENPPPEMVQPLDPIGLIRYMIVMRG